MFRYLQDWGTAGLVMLICAVCTGTVAAGRSPETDLAAPGAPLYEAALRESVQSLMSKQEQAELGAQGRPPSPGPDYYWCENCKTYHRRQTPASPQQTPPAQGQAVAPAPQNGAVPSSPGPDTYWCENCKTYHKRQDTPNQHGAAASLPQATPAAVPGTDTRPPAPGNDYYWCDNCKTYHQRQEPGAAPQAHTAPPPAGSAAAQAPGGDFYYCENCKTYHRRQHPAHQSVEDLIVAEATNRPNPLIHQ